MGLLDSILGAASGKSDASGGVAPLIGVLGGLLAQSGGLQGLANKFSQSGEGNAFASWVGLGEHQPISSNQVQNALGPEQVKALAAKMGIDPAQASNFLAEYLPKIVDKLTPAGKIDPGADHQLVPAGRHGAHHPRVAVTARRVPHRRCRASGEPGHRHSRRPRQLDVT